MSIIKFNEIGFSSKREKRMQTLDCRKIFAYEPPKEIIDKNDKINKQKILYKYK